MAWEAAQVFPVLPYLPAFRRCAAILGRSRLCRQI